MKIDNHLSVFLFVVLLVCLVFVPAVSVAQTSSAPAPAAAPAPAQTSCVAGNPSEDPNCGLHFVAGTSFYQLADGKQGTSFDIRAPFTPRFSGFAALFTIPGAQGNITVAGPDFRDKASHLFGKNLSAKSSFNLDKIELFARVGLGSEVNSINNKRSFAYLAEGGFEIPVATVNGGPVIKFGTRIGFLGVTHYGAAPERFVLGSNAAISPTATLNF